MMIAPPSNIRQNFSEASENALNKQITAEFSASYTYQAMASYLSRSEVALNGFAKFCSHSASEEREHALKLISYMNKRGGKVYFAAIPQPASEWKSALQILEEILALEKKVNGSLLDLFRIAEESKDPQLADLIASEFLKEQVSSIAEIGAMLTQLKRVGEEGLGLYLWDKELLEHN